MQILDGDFSDFRVIELIQLHSTTARAATSPGSAHALNLNELQTSDVHFWTIWDGEVLLGIGALKPLSRDHGEVKSMHVVQSVRNRGIGGALLRHIIEIARVRGMSRLSLETGSWQYFHPAREFYKRYGFKECAPFADYVLDPNSIFMSLDLTTGLSEQSLRDPR